ncbi:MAG: hypothetical protein VX956_16530 [Gemmatimonadota bacterium]|nr:hypothetical protein [Gemmatimonadota bacterium]
MTYPCLVFSLVVLGTMVASCGGEGSLDPTASGGDDDEPQMNRMIRANPSFAGDIQEIFVRRGCTNADGCHVLGQGSLTLRANAPENHGNLVNVVAPGAESGYVLVKPFDATNSYVVIRLEGRQRIGLTMPFGSSLDSIDLTNIKNWINNGALNN